MSTVEIAFFLFRRDYFTGKAYTDVRIDSLRPPRSRHLEGQLNNGTQEFRLNK